MVFILFSFTVGLSFSLSHFRNSLFFLSFCHFVTVVARSECMLRYLCACVCICVLLSLVRCNTCFLGIFVLLCRTFIQFLVTSHNTWWTELHHGFITYHFYASDNLYIYLYLFECTHVAMCVHLILFISYVHFLFVCFCHFCMTSPGGWV